MQADSAIGAYLPSVSDELRAYERFRTRSPEEAQLGSVSFLSPHRLRVRDTSEFSALAQVADADGATVCHVRYGCEVTIERAPQQEYLAVLAPITGELELEHRGRRHVVVAGRALAVLPPGRHVHMRWAPGSEVFSLRLDVRTLRRAMRTLAPDAPEDLPLRFAGPVVDLRAGVSVYGAAQLLATVFGQYAHPEAVPRHVLRHLADHAAGAALLSLEHNHRDEIRSAARRRGCVGVRTAVDLIEGETSAVLTVAELARRSGVTTRTLEMAFRKAMSVSPYAYMQRQRMQKAHLELQAADPADGVTVTGVAMRWGFGHAGRFAARYRQTFGVPPSSTLRCG
ncbi:AraC family transcriptional regulator [Pseudonocardia sulfidoxydans]|uniref:AraC family transcriptional regulator n=1 Tax=Pseudonocardia sulfidoxydans TaxID=54011 RepID=UPI001649A0FF|nr:AraC family transcriptional regulator [Pseudonocardia sulfidoxydans]